MIEARCSCGCGTLITITEASEPCGCGCDCCIPVGKTREDEIRKLRQLQHATEPRLTDLNAD